LSGIQLQTNSAALLAVTGSAASVVMLFDCYLNCTNNTGISSAGSNASALITLLNCSGNLGTTGIALFAVSNGGIQIDYCVLSNTGASTTNSTISSAAVLGSRYTRFSFPVTTSNTAVLGLTYCEFNTLAQNVTPLTVNGTGGSGAYFCRFASGSASALSIGSGVNLVTNAIQLSSSNSALTAGAGTLTYNAILSDTTNGTLSTTTLTPKGLVGMQNSTAPSAGFIGEQIRSALGSGSAITLSTGTGANVTSISLTPGIWDVSGIVMFGGGAITGTIYQASISTVSAASGTKGDNFVEGTAAWSPTAVATTTLTIPSYRISLAATTTVYLTTAAAFTLGTVVAFGRISATRVA